MTMTPPPPFAAPVPVAAAPVAAPPAAPVPSLVEAFAALLAAEQKVGVTPSAASAPAVPAAAVPPEPAALTDEMIDAITAKVLARLSDQSRPSILDVAERLVREEIERIKTIE
jgi:hypothetical protein